MYYMKKRATSDKPPHMFPETAVGIYANVELIPNSDGSYSGWIYINDRLVEEIRAFSISKLAEKCETYILTHYEIVREPDIIKPRE